MGADIFATSEERERACDWRILWSRSGAFRLSGKLGGSGAVGAEKIAEVGSNGGLSQADSGIERINGRGRRARRLCAETFEIRFGGRICPAEIGRASCRERV